MNGPKDINVDDIVKNETREKVEIDITEFDNTSAYLELPEELDDKTIGYLEREIRSSVEYRNYINYLKNELDLTKCSLMPGIDINENPVSLEFHHYPLTLFEITKAVGLKILNNLAPGEKVSCFDISERVMEEHYKNNIGLVPLTKTMHEMAHNRSIIIPISKVNGNYKEFNRIYDEYIDEDVKDRIVDLEMSSDSDESKEYNSAKLKKKIIDYKINYYRDEEDSDDDKAI